MPSTYVCILHSDSGRYSDDLVGNALRCLLAIQSSVSAGSPDFIPTMAVFVADPLHGTQCVFSSAVPDRNHALDRVDATCPSLTDAAGNMFSLEDPRGTSGQRLPDSGTVGITAFAQLFRLRSPRFLQQAVLQATLRCNCAAPHANSNKAKSTPQGIGSSMNPETSSSCLTINPYGSLAGALLAALCYLRTHPSSTFTAAAVSDMKINQETGQVSEVGGSTANGSVLPSSPLRSAGSILVFSDAKTGGKPTFSAECALAVAAVTASKMGVVVSCFGNAVAPMDAAAENRLGALASSLGGLCASRFDLRDLGRLLEGARAAVQLTGHSVRRKRDRMASQYVITPTMLPLEPPSGWGGAVTRGGKGASTDVSGRRVQQTRRESIDGDAAELCASNLGWLCPNCMAVISRNGFESTTADQNTTDERTGVETNMGPTCPYCASI